MGERFFCFKEQNGHKQTKVVALGPRNIVKTAMNRSLKIMTIKQRIGE
jgi:hypothetical protein